MQIKPRSLLEGRRPCSAASSLSAGDHTHLIHPQPTTPHTTPHHTTPTPHLHCRALLGVLVVRDMAVREALVGELEGARHRTVPDMLALNQVLPFR